MDDVEEDTLYLYDEMIWNGRLRQLIGAHEARLVTAEENVQPLPSQAVIIFSLQSVCISPER